MPICSGQWRKQATLSSFLLIWLRLPNSWREFIYIALLLFARYFSIQWENLSKNVKESSAFMLLSKILRTSFSGVFRLSFYNLLFFFKSITYKIFDFKGKLYFWRMSSRLSNSEAKSNWEKGRFRKKIGAGCWLTKAKIY